jgi:hypothetical protein
VWQCFCIEVVTVGVLEECVQGAYNVDFFFPKKIWIPWNFNHVILHIFHVVKFFWHYDFHAWHSFFINVWVHIVGRFMIVNSCVINFIHMFYFYLCDQCHLKNLVWLMSSKLIHVVTFTCRTITFCVVNFIHKYISSII